MKDLTTLKVRYQRDPLPVQLGGLASNLARVAWCMRRPGSRPQLAPLFRESKYFAEWAAGSADPGVQAALAEVQVELASWERQVARHGLSQKAAEQSEAWAAELLALAGLTARDRNV